ncbi:MAG: hypothetical protein AB8B95_14780 [Pseudohongiellaceae bacterium]
MNEKQKLLIEIIGVMGIVLSLVFVGMQLNFEAEVALSEQYANRAESIKSDLRTRLESEALMSALEIRWEFGERPSWWNEEYERQVTVSDASAKQVWANIYNIQLGLYQADNLYFQYQQGLLDEEFWKISRDNVKESLQDSFVRDVYLDSYLPIREVVLEILNVSSNETRCGQDTC